MKFPVRFLCVFAFVISIAAAPATYGQGDFLVTPASAGKIRIGMTVAEAKAAAADYFFKRTSDGEGIALIEVSDKFAPLMLLYAGEEDPEAPINEKAVVEHIEVTSHKFRTSEGVEPGMPVSEAEGKVGKIKEIVLSEIESREFGTFSNQPEGIVIRLQGKYGFAGRYAPGARSATSYEWDARVFSLIINSPPVPEGFSSVYTDLGTDCKGEDPGEDGQHSSTHCKGYGGYRVHIFDSATTLEFRIESEDGSFSLPLASQSLSYKMEGRKLEWRLKDGEPFAVILRTFKYKRGDDGTIKYPEETTGEYLVVKGLKGFEGIEQVIDVSETANANEQARQAADSGSQSEDSSRSRPVKEYNDLIKAAITGNLSWPKSPMQVIRRLTGEFEEIRSRSIEMVGSSSEEPDTIEVTVTDDGFLDDSVRGERNVYVLKKDSAGNWMVESIRQSWRCWEGRGHQDFSAKPCI